MPTILASTFTGFNSPHYTMVPDELFDELLVDLSGAELKVLLYIIRRTFGFKRDADAISLSQMLSGITTKEGRILDRGIGLSKPTLLGALRSLIAKNIIQTQRQRSVAHGDEPTVYKLKFAAPLPSSTPRSTPTAPTLPTATSRPTNGNLTTRGKKTLPPPQVKKVNPPVVKKLDHTRNSSTRNRISNIRKEEAEPMSEKVMYAEMAIVLEEAPGQQSPEDGANKKVRTSAAQQKNEQVYAETTIVLEGKPASHPNEVARQTTTNDITPPHATAPAGFTPVGGDLDRHPPTPPSPGSADRDAIFSCIAQFAQEFDDKASLKSSTSRADNLRQRAGLNRTQFLNCLWEARAITKDRITHPPRASQPITAKMGYFFSVLAERSGLTDEVTLSANAHLKYASLAV